MKDLILNELWCFCEKEFKADFEHDTIECFGYNEGMSDRTEKFVEQLIKNIEKI